MEDKRGRRSLKNRTDDSGSRLVISVPAILRTLVMIVAVMVCFRLPIVLWIKIPLVITLLIAGRIWMLRTPVVSQADAGPVDHFKKGRAAEAGKNYEEAIRHYELAAGDPPKPNHATVRLLVAYDRAGKLGQAKTLIQRMNGRKFPDSAADELEEVVEKYFPVRIRRTDGGSQLVLV